MLDFVFTVTLNFLHFHLNNLLLFFWNANLLKQATFSSKFIRQQSGMQKTFSLIVNF